MLIVSLNDIIIIIIIIVVVVVVVVVVVIIIIITIIIVVVVVVVIIIITATQLCIGFTNKTVSCDGRVVKALDLKSNGVSPRRFEPCSQRIVFFLFLHVYVYRCIL